MTQKEKKTKTISKQRASADKGKTLFKRRKQLILKQVQNKKVIYLCSVHYGIIWICHQLKKDEEGK